MKTPTRRGWSLLIVTALAAASVLPAPYATLWPDMVRDTSISLALARGEAFPLVGPTVNFGPRMGPAWYYLMAPILAAFPSLTAASVGVAVLGSLKFYGLYFLGRMLSGDRLGLCLAVAAAIPSVAVFQWNAFFQPNVLEAAIAAVLILLALALKRRSLAVLYAAGAMLGLAIQIHPTALFYYPAILLALLRLEVRGLRLAVHVAGTLLAIAVWFAPLLFVAGIDQLAGLGSGMARVGTGLDAFAPLEVLTVLRTAYVDIPMAIGETYALEAGVPLRLWRVCLILSVLAIAWGIAATALERERRWIVAAVACLLAGWIIATAARTYTSYYLVYSLLPLQALVLGFALERILASSSRGPRALGVVAMSAIVLCFVASAIGAFKLGGKAYMESRLPLLQDLQHPARGRVGANLVTVAARDAFARHVCAMPSGVTLHGDLAFALAASTGLDLRLHCPGRESKVTILGPTAAGSVGWTSLASSRAAVLGKRPAEAFQGLAVLEVKQVIHPQTHSAIEPEWYYFEVLRDRRPLTRVTLAFHAAPRDAVMVHRLKPFDSRWQVLRIERDGRPAAPALSTFNSDVYLSDGAGSDWRIEFETDAPQWVDVHVF